MKKILYNMFLLKKKYLFILWPKVRGMEILPHTINNSIKFNLIKFHPLHKF